MTDIVNHECGIAMIRLRKPLEYYIEKYGTPRYAASRMYLLMEKQHNRGQDGAGIASIKLDMPAGQPYINRIRSVEAQAIQDIFRKVNKPFRKAADKFGAAKLLDAEWVKQHIDFTGELFLGHLRYGTHGELSEENCHPFLRQNNWRSRNLVIAGNFNMTNVDELFSRLVELGQHPRQKADTVTVMEKIGHFLDEENQRQFERFKAEGLTNQQITPLIEQNLDVGRVLQRSCRDFDGGYAMAGMIGNGAAFVARDPNGIRPAYFYEDDEIVVVASEKPAIKTVFNVDYGQIQEIKPGHALILQPDGSGKQEQFLEPGKRTACSFERVYFSRGSDPDIYTERKALGRQLTTQVLESIDYDLDNTVFSYIPNTAETAFLGLLQGLEDFLTLYRKDALRNRTLSETELDHILALRPRVEKLVHKDVKLRTFITGDSARAEMVNHVYDMTYEVIQKRLDTLVVIDDSIVRGTTLEQSILTMLDRLEPRRILILSSAPPICYPDCYGIDMSKMGDFVAFRALISLLTDDNREEMLEETYDRIMAARITDQDMEQNFVQPLYHLYTHEQLSNKIAQIVRPKNMRAEVEVIYQTVEQLHRAIPNHSGDWYFTGNYPTPGGNRVVNRAFANYMEGKSVRAY
jgi:amidophosphoribosyltransferase